MLMNNDHLSPLLFRQSLQAFRKVQLFCNKQLFAESTNLLESHSLAKNKRSRCPPFNSTQNIPSLRDQPWYQIPGLITKGWNILSRIKRWAPGSFIFCERMAFQQIGD